MFENPKSPGKSNVAAASAGAPRHENGLSTGEANSSGGEAFHAFLNASTEAIVLADKELNFLALNQAALRLMAPDSEASAIVGKNIVDVVPGIRESGRYDAYRRVIETGEPFVADSVVPHPSFGELLLSVRAFRVRDGMGLIVSDNTARKRNEALVLRSEKLESLALLAGGIAHDFNNLLSGIYGYMDLALQDAPPQGKGARFLNSAMRTIDRARGITRQLLTFSRGGAPNCKTDALFPLVEETVRFCLSGSNVACEFSVEDDLKLCEFDRTQIGQVIENIVINAQQAMPQGGTLKIAAFNTQNVPEVLQKNGVEELVCLAFTDTGIGIPENLIANIFDPFFSTKQQGSGLGLATCHSIIKRHNGCIDVSSTPGEGTTFRICLPASEEAVPEKDSPMDTKHQGLGTVLVMDDQLVVLDAFRYMLENFGYGVHQTTHGEEAVAAYLNEKKKGTPYCAVILDLTIPGKKGGLEVIDQIRRDDAQLPVFVTSGYSNDPVMSDPKKHGFTDQIAKPFTYADLAAVFNKYM